MIIKEYSVLRHIPSERNLILYAKETCWMYIFENNIFWLSVERFINLHWSQTLPRAGDREWSYVSSVHHHHSSSHNIKMIPTIVPL